MAQQSTPKSPSATLEQMKQADDSVSAYGDCELRQMLHLSPQVRDNDKGKGFVSLDLPSSSQWKQAYDLGLSFSSAPHIGNDHLAQPQDANDDLLSAVLQGFSRPSTDPQLARGLNQVPSSTNELREVEQLQNPLTDLHLATSYSTFQRQYVQSPQNLSPILLNDLSIMNTLPSIRTVPEIQKNDVIQGSTVQIRLPGIQGIPNPLYRPSHFNQESGSSLYATNNSNYQSGFNLADNSSYNPQSLSITRPKRKMYWEEANVPDRRRWNAMSGGDQGQSSRYPYAQTERFSLYDPRYEEMGLPMDPHLRLFDASKEIGRANPRNN